MKAYAGNFDTAGSLEFLGCFGGSASDNRHTEASQITENDDIPQFQLILDFQQKLSDAAFQFTDGIRRTFGDTLDDFVRIHLAVAVSGCIELRCL